MSDFKSGDLIISDERQRISLMNGIDAQKRPPL